MYFSTASSEPSSFAGRRPLAAGFLLLFFAFWFVSFSGTTDLTNWWLENLLVVIFLAVLLLTARRFAFSDLSYLMILLFLVLHVYGAKYAYADNPFGFLLQRRFHSLRNPYDRIVHTSFGLLMAYPVRELLLRRMKTPERWSRVLPVELILSMSGLFELIEWSIADVFSPANGETYVGTQGDIWDAQKDMFVATCGALAAMVACTLIKRAVLRRKMSPGFRSMAASAKVAGVGSRGNAAA